MQFLSSALWWIFVGILALFNVIANVIIMTDSERRFFPKAAQSCSAVMAIAGLLSIIVVILAFVFISWQGGLAILVAALIINTICRAILRHLSYRSIR